MSPNSIIVRDIEALLATAKTYDVENPDRAIRLALLEKVEALHRKLDTPAEAMFRQLTNYSETAAVRTTLQMGALAKMPREGVITARDLATSIDANEEVLSIPAILDKRQASFADLACIAARLMRILTATGIVRSAGEDVYAHTPFSLAYLEGSEVDFYELCVDEISPVANRIPEYVTTHEPDSIIDPKRSPYSWANNKEGKSFYEVLLDFPDRLARFNRAMTTQEAALPVLGMFPFSSLAISSDTTNSGRVFLVDVAGGRGQSLLQIKKEMDGAGLGHLGKLILQDRKPVLDAIPNEQLPGVEKMVIDFFTPQPVKNAHIYYLRRIMHNWQDTEARQILKNIADAMAPDSRLLIGEMIVPSQPEGVDRTVYWMDLCMLVIGGKERSEKEFTALLSSAGLELVKVWRSKIGPQTVIECRLRQQMAASYAPRY